MAILPEAVVLASVPWYRVASGITGKRAGVAR